MKFVRDTKYIYFLLFNNWFKQSNDYYLLAKYNIFMFCYWFEEYFIVLIIFYWTVYFFTSISIN